MFDLVTRIVSALTLTFYLAASHLGLIPNDLDKTEKIQLPNRTTHIKTVPEDLLPNFDNSSLDFEATISREGNDLDPAYEISDQDSRVATATSASSEPQILLEGPPEYKWMDFKVTYYTKDEPGMNGKGITSTGRKVKAGRTIAVDPRIIPYGTKVYIEGIGYRIAEDCGGAVKGKHIDVYVDRHDSHLLDETISRRLRIVN